MVNTLGLFYGVFGFSCSKNPSSISSVDDRFGRDLCVISYGATKNRAIDWLKSKIVNGRIVTE